MSDSRLIILQLIVSQFNVQFFIDWLSRQDVLYIFAEVFFPFSTLSFRVKFFHIRVKQLLGHASL